MMNCKEAGEQVNAYLDGSMSDKDMEAFLAHIRSCPSCMDELETYFSVDYALRALNEEKDLSSYDIRGLLLADLSGHEEEIRSGRINRRLFYTAVLAAEIIILFVILMQLLPGANLRLTDQLKGLLQLFRK